MIPETDIKPGDYFLVFDTHPNEQNWSLWRRLEDPVVGVIDSIVVDWDGDVSEGTCVGAINWLAKYVFYLVRPENIDTIIMAARHMTTEQWYRLAWRQSEHQHYDPVR